MYAYNSDLLISCSLQDTNKILHLQSIKIARQTKTQLFSIIKNTH
mgnify:CR=1 FL=1